MSKFTAHINVMPRAEISDPQGQTVERTLPSIGFEGITGVRVGKRITLTVEAPDEESARRIMEEDPVIAGGYARGELRPFRVSLMRGRAEG